MSEHRIIQGDVMDGLRSLPDNCVQCTVTSPPYFALRQYLFDGAVPTPSEAHNGGEWPNPGKVEYRGHVVVVTDDLTAKFAENLVKKMIKDLKRKGVEFDE